MNGCEGFEIAVEMRLHGAADAEASRRLDEHLAGCASCREFEAQSKEAETVLHGSSAAAASRVDWEKARGAIRRLSARSWIGLAAVVSTSLVAYPMAMAEGRLKGEEGPWALVMIALAIAALVKQDRTRRKAAATAESHYYLVTLYAKEITRQIREALGLGAGCLLLAALAAAKVFFSWPRASSWMSDRVIGLLALGAAAYLLGVQLPRLLRERIKRRELAEGLTDSIDDRRPLFYDVLS